MNIVASSYQCRSQSNNRGMNVCFLRIKMIEMLFFHVKIPKLAKTVGASHSRPICFLYSKNDHMIEAEKSLELAEHVGVRKENVLKFAENGENVLRNVGQILRSDGPKARVAIVFDKDGHYVQKKRSDFITNLVETILK